MNPNPNARLSAKLHRRVCLVLTEDAVLAEELLARKKLAQDVAGRLSDRALLVRPGRVESVLEELAVRSLPASCLTLEITETAVTNLLHAVLRLTPLREAGIHISVDDFGSGNTSLSSLPHLLAGFEKALFECDQQFVRRSRDSQNDLAIVRTIIELARRLGLVSVAEGVETEDLYDDMVAMGFDLLQGYSVAKPLREDELAHFVQLNRRAHSPRLPPSVRR